jgi:hypothetical protein
MNTQIIVDNINIFIALFFGFLTIIISITANLDKLEKNVKNHKDFFGIFLFALFIYIGLLMLFFMVTPILASPEDKVRYERWNLSKLFLSVIQFILLMILYGGQQPILIKYPQKLNKLRNNFFRFTGLIMTIETIWLFFDSMMKLLSYQNN